MPRGGQVSSDSVLPLFAFGSEGWGDELLHGATVTLRLALASCLLGMFLGLFLCVLRLSRWRAFRFLGGTATILLRGTPEFLVLLLVFYGSEAAFQSILDILGLRHNFQMPRFLAAVLGLAIIFSAYTGEVFRGAYVSVPLGQTEAAASLGLSSWHSFIRVRFPQMWRAALASLGNLWMVLLKDTSLAAAIALEETLRIAKIAGETTRMPLVFLLAAAGIYLVLTACSDVGRHFLERYARRGWGSTSGLGGV